MRVCKASDDRAESAVDWTPVVTGAESDDEAGEAEGFAVSAAALGGGAGAAGSCDKLTTGVKAINVRTSKTRLLRGTNLAARQRFTTFHSSENRKASLNARYGTNLILTPYYRF
jgi:hypothetical protein